METLGRLRAEGKTIVVASHDPLVFESETVDRVIAIKDGRVERAPRADRTRFEDETSTAMVVA
jgi:putative ABC transport system ATP-binding protein